MLDSVELKIRGGNLAAAEKQDEGAEAERTGANRQSNPKKLQTSTPGKAKGRTADAKDAQVGRVLRSVYQQTIDEAVPQEMLDLLNKLG